MFTVDQFIDTVQNGKKQFVKTFVLEDSFRKPLENFIDAQAEYTRKAAKVGQQVVTELATAAMDQSKIKKFIPSWLGGK